jgi:hypothetical protein
MNIFFDNKSVNNMGKVIHAGAGTGHNLNDYASQQFTDVLFLEPIPKLFKQLESKIIKFSETSTECNVAFLNAALCSAVDTDKEKNFYVTQPNRYSSFHKASKLQTLFQNLKIEQEILVSTISFAELIKKAVLDKDKKNVLVLQINGEEFDVIAKAEESELILFSSIVIEQSKNGYFEKAKNSDDLIALMKEKGFQLAIETESDVVFRSLVFRKDESMIKLKILNEKTSAQAIYITELESKLEANIEAKSSESTKAAEQNKNQSARITELENQLKASNEANLSESTKAVEQSKNQSARISELESSLRIRNKEDENSDKLNYLLEQVQNQSSLIKKNQEGLISKLNYGFNNSVKQVESFIGVQSYLETGQLAMQYHGWPISSDVALFLLGKVEKNNYDLIIEFGSGTSTQLFAKAINNKVKIQTDQIDNGLVFMGRDKRDSSELSPLPLDLPSRIVTFEHNKKYYNKTMSELESNRLSYLVDLVHAPLVEMTIEKEEYLYYSCGAKLSQLANIYADRSAKILVLIDGPPGATGPLARLPAVPLLLNHLGKHQLDIVLDDYNRKEEKDTVIRWKKQFDKRGLAYDEEVVPCEKGAFFCRINP